MGYYTTYRLKWKNYDDGATPIKNVSIYDKIEEFIRIKNNIYYGIQPSGEPRDECKWYDHEKDMKVLSKKFPSVLFTLYGEGEETGDIWRKYFLNGKIQVANVKMVFEEFDENKLK